MVVHKAYSCYDNADILSSEIEEVLWRDQIFDLGMSNSASLKVAFRLAGV